MDQPRWDLNSNALLALELAVPPVTSYLTRSLVPFACCTLHANAAHYGISISRNRKEASQAPY